MADAATDAARGFTMAPDPDHPGWLRWRLNDPECYNEAVLGTVLVRAEGESSARVRIFPSPRLRNNAGNIHGGATLGLVDVALFAASKVLRDIDASGSVTLGVDVQFIGAGDPALPLDAAVEILRETGRLMFLRGLVVQGETLVASFSGTTRKPSRR